MHSRIFQIASNPIEEDEYIGSESISENSYGYFGIDYADNSPSPREEDIEWLKDSIPASMFDVDGKSITILNDGDEYLSDVMSEARKILDRMQKPKDLLGLDNWRLRDLLKKLGHGDMLFYFEEWCGGVCYLEDVIQWAQSHVGETLYIGAILDYHF